MADPHFRTISGFESLVQKEWVAMGHPFTTRGGLTTDNSNEEVPDGQVRYYLYLLYTFIVVILFHFSIDFINFSIKTCYSLSLSLPRNCRLLETAFIMHSWPCTGNWPRSQSLR